MPKYQVTKTYGHNLGLSATFRQHRTDTHCKFLHGYALGVKLKFEAYSLDDRNWVLGFGDLKPVKKWLEETFDHKTLIAADDPEIDVFELLHSRRLIDLVVVDRVGCESFAEMIYHKTNQIVFGEHRRPGVKLVSVEVMEHGANSAIYFGDKE
jgi:6-pyruvoyltetrahydropterin/6-carboxytetrahydropterin synthase